MKLLAVVVTYYPQKNVLLQNIEAFISYVDKVLIWENTPFTEKQEFRYLVNEKIEYCGDGVNSISHALNYAWKYANKASYDYILIMDQDSQWVDFPSYLKQTIYNDGAPEGIWGPHISGNIKKSGIEEVYSVINSGTLVKVTLVNRIGGWNEMFDIDGVDDEFCLRAKRLGIKTYRINESNLLQCFGSPRIVFFLWKRGELRNDSPLRLYNIYRNFILLIRMFPESKMLKDEFKRCWMSRIKWIIFFENNRVRKLCAIVRGIYDGITYKL